MSAFARLLKFWIDWPDCVPNYLLKFTGFWACQSWLLKVMDFCVFVDA